MARSAIVSLCLAIRSYLWTSFRDLLSVGFMKLPFGRIEAGVALLSGDSLPAISVMDLTGEAESFAKVITGLSI